MPRPTLDKTYIEVEGQKVPVKVYRERRRSIRFYIGKSGAILRIPNHLTREQQQKEWNRFCDWAKKKISSKEGIENLFGKTYQDGNTLIVGKRQYRLSIKPTPNKTHSGKIEAGRVISLRLAESSNDEQRKKAAPAPLKPIGSARL